MTLYSSIVETYDGFYQVIGISTLLPRSDFSLIVNIYSAMYWDLQPLAFPVVRSSLNFGPSLYLGIWASLDFIPYPRIPRNDTLLTQIRFRCTCSYHSHK